MESDHVLKGKVRPIWTKVAPSSKMADRAPDGSVTSRHLRTRGEAAAIRHRLTLTHLPHEERRRTQSSSIELSEMLLKIDKKNVKYIGTLFEHELPPSEISNPILSHKVINTLLKNFTDPKNSLRTGLFNGAWLLAL